MKLTAISQGDNTLSQTNALRRAASATWPIYTVIETCCCSSCYGFPFDTNDCVQMRNISPIVICGCHGGGTSFVARLLRLSGLFLGADAGPLKTRKFHESAAFLRCNMEILAAYGDDRGWDYGTITMAELAFRCDVTAAIAAQRVKLGAILDEFWGEHSTTNTPWGWKDPRNSLTFPVWKILFPRARAVVIRKNSDTREPKSASGAWFRRVATESMRESYMSPVWLQRFPDTLCVQFEDLTNDLLSFNSLLDYCGLSAADTGTFERRLVEAELER